MLALHQQNTKREETGEKEAADGGEEDEGDMAGRRSVSMVELDWGGNDAERERIRWEG